MSTAKIPIAHNSIRHFFKHWSFSSLPGAHEKSERSLFCSVVFWRWALRSKSSRLSVCTSACCFLDYRQRFLPHWSRDDAALVKSRTRRRTNILIVVCASLSTFNWVSGTTVKSLHPPALTSLTAHSVISAPPTETQPSLICWDVHLLFMLPAPILPNLPFPPDLHPKQSVQQPTYGIRRWPNEAR